VGARGLKLSPQISQNRAALLTAEESEAGGGRYAAEHEAVRRANEAYEAYRVRGISRGGRRFGGGPPSPYQLAETPTGKVNTTDPDSRLMKVTGGYVQGYNAQAAVSEEQIVLAAEISVDSPNFGHLEPMVDAAGAELPKAGVGGLPEVVVADAGYWHHEQMDSLRRRRDRGPDPARRQEARGARPGWQGGRYEWMPRLLSTELGKRLYRKRSQTVEPMFGHTKHNRGMGRFHRRGRSAARTEWRLITATHNLMMVDASVVGGVAVEAAVAEVDPARELPDHQQVSPLDALALRRAGVEQRRARPHRSQVGEQAEALSAVRAAPARGAPAR
jgi:hypothetical protein